MPAKRVIQVISGPDAWDAVYREAVRIERQQKKEARKERKLKDERAVSKNHQNQN